VNVRIYTTRDDQQAVRAELLLPGHRPADLGDPATPDPDISDLAPTRDDERSATDDKLKIRDSHAGILPRPGCTPITRTGTGHAHLSQPAGQECRLGGSR
jgi:hypothetical protein